MSEVHTLSLAEAGRRLRTGALGSRDLVEACLARIEALDGRLHSYITVLADEARAAAARADAEIAAGDWRGPLHGIPIGLKDIYATAGVRTTCHSRLLQDWLPDEDAETVRRLRGAGAVILGKLATHEFAIGGPSFDLPWPPARNPWNHEHFTGGSSSGSAAATAAGLCFAAMGSDTGGSIRGAAGRCGLAGLKPTYGLVSRRGVYPLSWTQDHAGPLARSIEDCALMMQVLAGYDPGDPASVDTKAPDFAGALERGVEGLKVGVARNWYAHEGAAGAETVGLIDDAAETLRGLGLEVRDLTLPDIADFHACGRIIILGEAYTIHRAWLRERPEAYGRHFRHRVGLGAFVTARDYLEAQRMRARLRAATREAMGDVDLVLTFNQHGSAERMEEVLCDFHFFGLPSPTMPFNVTGQPALTVCAGFSDNGLPIGVQLAAHAFRDDLLLGVGHAFERARPEAARISDL